MEGPKIMFTIPLFGGIAVTETVTNSWLLIVVVFILCKFLTSNLQKIPKGKQVLAEKYVTMITGLVKVIGGILCIYGILQVGMSFSGHDPSQRIQGLMCIAGAIIIFFSPEILTAIQK